MGFFRRKKAPVDTFAFPASPTFVPEGLTKATPKYKRQAIIAMLSLAAFVLLYIAFTGWFAWTAYLIFANLDLDQKHSGGPIIAGLCSGFLALFMAKGLVFVQRGSGAEEVELKKADHPRLFKFLHAIADEAHAPKPHRVFLSPRVNAAVFYNLTMLDLIFPSRKNLEIGLGLVNTLTLHEFKAVLAHEFGHFAQKSMAVGRWVYVARQVATSIVAKRDAFDRFLGWLSRIDLRVAWIGWTMQFVVWSIRSLMDTLLSGVILAERALSREMEFQADLVSVSLCGSEALVNSLHKLSGADDAMDRAFKFAVAEHHDKKPVKDIFAVQTRILEHLRSIYNDPHYGAAPAPSAESPMFHRVFKTEAAAPPRMWSTHPANADREENAKIVFVQCQDDDRSAWELFPDAAALREKVTKGIFADAETEKDEQPPAPIPLEETLARLDDSYSSITVDRRYRGAYLARSVTRAFKNVADMYTALPKGTDVATAIAGLYPQSFGDALDKLRELYDEKSTFDGLQKGYLEAPGGVVRWRGEEVPPRRLPKILKSLDEEIAPLKDQLDAHDREVRSVHAVAAKKLGNGWDAYLVGLASLVHYAEHTHADLTDLHGVFNNVYAVVTADGRVTKKELRRLIDAGNDLYAALEHIYSQAGAIVLDERTLKRAGITNFKDALGEFRLKPATAENIDNWLGVVDGWANATAGALMAVRSAALQELLLCEDEVATLATSRQAAPAAPAPASIPADYPRLMPGEARPRQTKLGWWDRFQTADGWIAATARFIVALAVVGTVIVTGADLAFPRASNEPAPMPYEPTVLPPENTTRQPALPDPLIAPPRKTNPHRKTRRHLPRKTLNRSPKRAPPIPHLRRNRPAGASKLLKSYRPNRAIKLDVSQRLPPSRSTSA